MDLNSNDHHCGRCGNDCTTEGKKCWQGQCQAPCPSGGECWWRSACKQSKQPTFINRSIETDVLQCHVPATAARLVSSAIRRRTVRTYAALLVRARESRLRSGALHVRLHPACKHASTGAGASVRGREGRKGVAGRASQLSALNCVSIYPFCVQASGIPPRKFAAHRVRQWVAASEQNYSFFALPTCGAVPPLCRALWRQVLRPGCMPVWKVPLLVNQRAAMLQR